MSVLNQKEITIIKRNNKKDTFQPEKIAVAIKKGFDSVKDPNETAQDSHLVFTRVIEQIEEIASHNPNIKIEDYICGITNFVNEATQKSQIICSLRLWNMDSDELKAKNSLNAYIMQMLEEQLNLDVVISEALQEKNGIN